MIIPLLGAPNRARHRGQSKRELINFYLVANSADDEYPYIAYPTPGAELFADITGTEVRGSYEWRGRGYVVVDDIFYRVNSDGSFEQKGTLLTVSGRVEFASIEGIVGEIVLVDGQNGYSYLVGTDNFAIISDIDFPNGAQYVTAFDERFIVGVPFTSNWQISDTADGRTWQAINTASKRSHDDMLIAPVYNNLYLWLFGEESAEAWVDTGNADFPFERQPGLAISFGLITPHGVVVAGNQLYWVGRTAGGSPLIYQSNGFQPLVISTEAINYFLATNDISDCFCYNLTMEGHEWVVFNFPIAETTYVWDLTVQQWFQLSSYDTATKTYKAHFSTCHMLLNGIHIVGDNVSGKLYKLNFNVKTDKGLPIRRRITSDHMDFDGRFVRCSDLHIRAEMGVGLNSGQGVNPKMMLEVSKDFGNTWSNPLERYFGAIGNYNGRLHWGLLGCSRVFTYRATITDPVDVVVYGARATFSVQET